MAKRAAASIKEIVAKTIASDREEALSAIAGYIAREQAREIPYKRISYLPYPAFCDVGNELVEDGLAEWREMDIVLTDKGAAMFLDG